MRYKSPKDFGEECLTHSSPCRVVAAKPVSEDAGSFCMYLISSKYKQECDPGQSMHNHREKAVSNDSQWDIRQYYEPLRKYLIVTSLKFMATIFGHKFSGKTAAKQKQNSKI